MKNILYYILLLSSVCACQENVEKRFEGEDAVYFQIASYWKTQDSVEYSFAAKQIDTDTIKLRVNLQGDLVDYDRKVKVRVNDQVTTAKEGLHYQALKEDYVLPAGKIYTTIPIIIYKTDKALEERKVSVGLELMASQDLKLGITERTKVRIIFSNTLNKPGYWDSTIHYHFGTYSRKKHEICIQVLGFDFPAEGGLYAYDTWSVYGKYMSNYFEENYPIYDENNVAIEPWN